MDALPGARRDLLPVIAEPTGGRRRDGEEQALLRADDRAFRVQPHQTGRLRPDIAGGTDALPAPGINFATPGIREAGAEPGRGDLPPQLGLAGDRAAVR